MNNETKTQTEINELFRKFSEAQDAARWYSRTTNVDAEGWYTRKANAFLRDWERAIS